jgi:hypothetical protein
MGSFRQRRLGGAKRDVLIFFGEQLDGHSPNLIRPKGTPVTNLKHPAEDAAVRLIVKYIPLAARAKGAETERLRLAHQTFARIPASPANS